MVKYFFQPNVNEDLSYAQITGVSQTLLRQAPPGTTPPFILAYNASTVPILQLALESTDAVGGAAVRSRQHHHPPGPGDGAGRLAAVSLWRQAAPGAGRHRPGGAALQGPVGASTSATRSALQNLIIPAGTEKIGDIEYNVKLNSSPLKPAELNDVPIRTVNGTVVFVRDVANVHDGASPQTNLVRVDGQHAVLMSVLKTGSASTLQSHRAASSGCCPASRAQLPEDLNDRGSPAISRCSCAPRSTAWCAKASSPRR